LGSRRLGTSSPDLKTYEFPENIEIEFSDVWFAYPGSDNYVLQGINIKITNREKLAVVGYNGAGKSTFIKLLCKFYQPTKGKITLNGNDIREIPNEKYQQIISAVFQDFATLAFTISVNISMGESGGDLPKVILKAELSEFITSLPNGTDTFISKKFSSESIELSGGQGQKIALARALYKNAPILILDEPTASLDLKAESELYETFMKT
jgi:ABC-type multidrug transport system fused ATPase/permease subunit